MPRSRFSVAEARRIALAAQGLDRPRTASAVNSGHVRRVIDRLGLLQLDFVNVLVPAHRLVVYSRLGAHSQEVFARAVYGSGNFTEHWAHEASIVPVSCWPLLAYRRRNFRQTPHSPLFRVRNWRRYLDEVLAIVEDSGPVTSADLPPLPAPKRRPGDWHRSVPRWALEQHFGHGRLAVADRLPNFQRVYDLPRRVIAAAHRERELPEEAGRRGLLERAAAALGIATSTDLADYYRMPVGKAGPRLAELAAELRELADWLGLERIEVQRRGDLAAALASALPRAVR